MKWMSARDTVSGIAELESWTSEASLVRKHSRPSRVLETAVMHGHSNVAILLVFYTFKENIVCLDIIPKKVCMWPSACVPRELEVYRHYLRADLFNLVFVYTWGHDTEFLKVDIFVALKKWSNQTKSKLCLGQTVLVLSSYLNNYLNSLLL